MSSNHDGVFGDSGGGHTDRFSSHQLISDASATGDRMHPHREQLHDAAVIGRNTAGHADRAAVDYCDKVVRAWYGQPSAPALAAVALPIRQKGPESVRRLR
jgi:hypothetical protein